MKRKIHEQVAQKFTIAAGILMTRAFSAPPESNQRRCAFAAGPASTAAHIALARPGAQFDIVGLDFVPGREWKGPVDVFVEEFRENETKVWRGCNFWADIIDGPLYLLTDDPDTCFSFDGHSLVPLTGELDDRAGGIERARKRLREAALRLPLKEIERHRMM